MQTCTGTSADAARGLVDRKRNASRYFDSRCNLQCDADPCCSWRKHQSSAPHNPPSRQQQALKDRTQPRFAISISWFPRFVDCLPNGPKGHPTVQLFLAGGVPEVAWHLRELGFAQGRRQDRQWNDLETNYWMNGKGCDRREICREHLRAADGVEADDVIIPPARAKQLGLTSTVCFPEGNLLPRRLGDQSNVH